MLLERPIYHLHIPKIFFIVKVLLVIPKKISESSILTFDGVCCVFRKKILVSSGVVLGKNFLCIKILIFVVG